MANVRVMFCLEKYKFNNQSGFRWGRSTFDNLVNIKCRIDNVKRNQLVTTFFDIEKNYSMSTRILFMRGERENAFYLPIYLDLPKKKKIHLQFFPLNVRNLTP